MAKLDAAQIAFRASTEMLEAIDREVERVAAERPGEEVTRSDVVRAIIHRALLGGSGTLEQKVATLPGEGLGVKVYRTVLGESGTTEQKVATLPGEWPGTTEQKVATLPGEGLGTRALRALALLSESGAKAVMAPLGEAEPKAKGGKPARKPRGK